MKAALAVRLAMCAAVLLAAGSGIVYAASSTQITVEVIIASRNSTAVDQGLESLAREVTPVLNFKGFTLLKRSELTVAPSDQDEISIPGNRKVVFQLLGFSEGKARVSVSILAKRSEIFKTILLLVDKGTVLIGGPPYEDGALLMRIGARFND